MVSRMTEEDKEIRKKLDAIPTTTKTEKKTDKKLVALFIVAIIALSSYTIFQPDIEDIDPRNWFADQPEIQITPAEVELYKFNDLNTTESLNIELWIINIGEETAKDITVYIRSINQQGSIIFNDTISLTALLLRNNETCSGYYTIILPEETEKVYHTIEISWSDGRTSYSKITNF